jgi:hypothetical protein
MRLGLVPAAAILSILLAAPAAPAKRPDHDSSVHASAARCGGSKVPVRVGRKTTCRPLAKVFPKPAAVDLRLAYLRQALKFDPAKAVRGKKRKRARTLQSGFGAAGRRAQKKLLRLLPKALRMVDRRRAGARASGLLPGPASASAGCGPGPAGPVGQTGGASIGALGDNGLYVDAPAGHGLRVRVTFYSCGGVTNFRLPECPTADGKVDGKGSGEFHATIEVRDGNRVVSRNSSLFEGKAEAHGQVGPDAKLKFIEVKHTEEALIIATGEHAPIALRGGVAREVKITMPGGSYDPASAAVRFIGPDRLPDTGARSFAATADAALRTYRAAEPRWSSFDRRPYCAEPVFSPESNTLKLKKGDKKQLGVFARAQDGGQAREARWTLLNQENASFSPSTAEAPAPTISYTVTEAPEDGFVKVTVRVTSTAGVGEKAWTQPTEPQEAPAGFNAQISGTAVYDEGELGEGNSIDAQWSGGLELKQSPNPFPPGTPGAPAGIYEIVGGSVDYSFSGSAFECGSVEGSGAIKLSEVLNAPGALVLYEGEPRTYQLVVPMPVTAKVPGTKEACEDPEDNGETFDWFVGIGVPVLVSAPLPGGPVGDEWQITGSGSGNNGPGTPDQTWQWNLIPIP